MSSVAFIGHCFTGLGIMTWTIIWCTRPTLLFFLLIYLSFVIHTVCPTLCTQWRVAFFTCSSPSFIPLLEASMSKEIISYTRFLTGKIVPKNQCSWESLALLFSVLFISSFALFIKHAINFINTSALLTVKRKSFPKSYRSSIITIWWIKPEIKTTKREKVSFSFSYVRNCCEG